MALWLGCGGSESSSPANTTPADGGGSDAPVTKDSASETSSIVDAPFDGFIDAPEVSLTFGTCPTFTPCGGDEKGSWKISGGCLSDSILDKGKEACGDSLSISDPVIKAKGTVALDGTNVVRHSQVKLTAKIFVPNSGQCATGIGLGGCAGLGTLGAMQLGFDKMTCVDAADGGSAAGCDCNVETTQTTNETGTYTKSGNTIETKSGDTFDYCVEGSKLTYTQTNGMGNQDPLPLYIEITK